MPDPSEPTGVEPKAGDDQVEGVPATEGTTPAPAEGVPAEAGVARAPGVPPAAPMPPQQPGVEGMVSQADMDRLRSELNRQNYELQMAAEKRQREAEEWRMKAETANMPEEDRYKYLYEQSQERLSQVETRQAEQTQLIQWQYYIADRLGVNPSTLNPMEGVQGMIERAASQIERGQPQARPTPQLPAQPAPTRAPSAPTSTAPTSSFQEWSSGETWEERRKKIPKGRKAFEEWMEGLGEE